MQTTLRSDKYARTDGDAYGGCQWLHINRETKLYAFVFTPHRQQETQGLMRVSPAAGHSVGRQQSFACRFSGGSDSAVYISSRTVSAFAYL